MTPSDFPDRDRDRLRRRAVAALFAGVALASTGYIAWITVSTLVAQDMTGSSALAGLPVAVSIIGTAAGAWLLSSMMARSGRRRGLVLGYLLGTAGAVLSVAAALGGVFLLLLLGAACLGFANASIQLSRFAAADMFGRARRGSALGVVVWGSTVGAVIGPNLITPGAELAATLGIYRLAGPYLVISGVLAAAAVVAWLLLRPDPRELAEPDEAAAIPSREAGAPAFPAAQLIVALAALLGAQAVMVAVMTMTPLHVQHEGGSLAFIGLVISAHAVGMFAFSPLSGRLTDRLGSLTVVVGGMTLLAAASLLAAAAPGTSILLLVALFLLGLGWNLAFVGGSALLTHGLTLAARARLQGRADAVVWASSAVSSGASGLVLAVAGYPALAVASAVIVVIPVAVALSQRRRLPASPAPI
jgi:predicted MFS family arabinose efflux permease